MVIAFYLAFSFSQPAEHFQPKIPIQNSVWKITKLSWIVFEFLPEQVLKWIHSKTDNVDCSEGVNNPSECQLKGESYKSEVYFSEERIKTAGGKIQSNMPLKEEMHKKREKKQMGSCFWLNCKKHVEI